jgi:small subunit ribosomal protein S9
MSFNNSNVQPVYFGIGRRKTSVAKVTLIPGTGSLVVNHKPGALYLHYNSQYINSSKAPLTALGLENSYDIYVNTHGGGLRGQADAIKLGVARALCYISSDNRSQLKLEGFLIRDARAKERKKYGLRKARKAPQFKTLIYFMPKNSIHPEYYSNAKVYCDGQLVMKVGSTKPVLKVDIWSGTHPFYTGSQKLIDTEGRVERFMRKYGIDD